MAEKQFGEVDLLLVDGDSRHFSLAPSAIEVGAVRFGGWQVHPVVPPPERFPGKVAYLVKITFDLMLAPDVPVPPWVEVGFAFDGGHTVMDAVPRTSRAHAPARGYRLDENLTFVEVGVAGLEVVYLPEVWSTVVAYGAQSPEVRWRHYDLSPGSHTAWFVLLTEPGVTGTDVTASARYDLSLADSFGHNPATRPVVFHLDIVPGPATPPARTIEAAQPVTDVSRAPRVFISYAHDDSAHMDDVLAFANFLVREEGIDVVLDRWGQEISRDWSLWAIQSLREADFVLVIASPMCREVGEGRVDDTRHRGLQSEMGLIREAMHKERSASWQKYLPVVLPGGRLDDLPAFMQPTTFHHFIVTSFTRAGAENLLRTLTRQPAHVRPEPPAHVPPLPPRSM